MDRILPIAVAFITLLGPALLPAAQAGYVEENSFRFVQMDQDQSAFAADFHPNQSDPRAEALIAGGKYGNQGDATRFLATYDGHDWTYLFNDEHRDGPWVDVEWKPDGEYALVLGAGDQYRGSVVACRNPCNETGDLLELWRPEITPYAQQGFVGRQIDWHPSGDYALLAGSGLMRMNETFLFEHVDLGQETFYNALDWHPGGNWSLVQKDLNGFAICEDPCRNKTTEYTDHSADICYGMYPNASDCAVDPNEEQSRVNETEAKTYPGSKYIEDITFGPDGEKIYVSGVIHQRSRIMEISHHGSQDPDDWTWRYLEPKGEDHNETKYGEITSVDFNPNHPDRMLVGSTLDRQVMTWNTSNETFETLLSLPQPKMQDTLWHPSGTYALFPSRAGFYRYDPHGMPTTTITSPSEGGFHADGPVDLSGEAHPKEDGMNITSLETRLDQTAWSALDEANWTRAEDGTVHWNATVDPTEAGAGHHVIYARALDPVIVGASSGLSVCVGLSDDDVPDEDQLLSISVQDWNRSAETVTLDWTNVTRDHGYLPSQVDYTIARHPQGSPADVTEHPVEKQGSEVTLNQSSEDGEMVYQVKVTTCGQENELPYAGHASIDLSDPPERPTNSGDGDGSEDGANGSSGDAGDREPDAGGTPDGLDENPWKSPSDDPGSGDGDGSGDGSPSAQTESSGPSFVPGPQLPLALAALAVALLTRRHRD